MNSFIPYLDNIVFTRIVCQNELMRCYVMKIRCSIISKAYHLTVCDLVYKGEKTKRNTHGTCVPFYGPGENY